VPTMICNDIARDRDAGRNRSVGCQDGADGLGTGLERADVPGSASLLRAVITNGYGTTEAGSIVFTTHTDGRPTPDLSVGFAHPRVELRLVMGDDSAASEGVLP
jgi:acyl-CoA synthetase (AMP-forming)/AMP-acid ligase II